MIEIDTQEMGASSRIDVSHDLALDLILPPTISKESNDNGIQEMEPAEQQRGEDRQHD